MYTHTHRAQPHVPAARRRSHIPAHERDVNGHREYQDVIDHIQVRLDLLHCRRLGCLCHFLSITFELIREAAAAVISTNTLVHTQLKKRERQQYVLTLYVRSDEIARAAQLALRAPITGR